jgi:hypothetical protein
LCIAQKVEGVQEYDTSLMSKHSPLKASFYSAVLPGLGQIYNRKYWKVPILYAGLVTCIYFFNFNQRLYLEYRRDYILRVRADPNEEDEFYQEYLKTGLYSADYLQEAREFYRRYRDISVICLVGVYLANIADATVDAYFFDYDISPDLSLQIRPSIIETQSSASLGIKCTFKF